MTTDAQIVIGIRGDTAGGKAVKVTLDEIAKSGDAATKASDALEKEMQSLNGAANTLKNAFKGLIGAMGIREVIRMADEYTLLQGRIKLATRSTQEFEEAFRGLQRVSNQTGASLKDTVDVFQRLSFVRDEIKATVADMVGFTSTVQKLGVMSGATTDAMGFGLRQLGQAMSAGVVRAEEWNSVMENMPAVGKAVADQFGVTTGQLRLLVVEGMVASQDMFTAILNDMQRVEEEYAKMPMTVGRALSMLRNELTLFVGQTSQASGAGMAMVGTVDLLRVAVYGLGAAFNGVVTVVATAGALIVKSIEDMVNRSLDVINAMIIHANKLPGVEIGTFGRVDLTGGASHRDIVGAGFEDLMKQKQDLLSNGPKTVFDKAMGNVDPIRKSTQQGFTKDYKAAAAGLSGDEDALKRLKQAQKELDSLIKETYTDQERYNATVRDLNNLRAFADTEEEIRAIDRAIIQAGKDLDKIRLQAELDSPLAKNFKRLFNEIDDGFKDAFKDAFTQGDGGFKRLVEGWKATFKNFLAELAYMAMARPVIVSVIGAAGGSMGLSGAAMGNILGTSGAGGGFGNITSIGQGLSSLNNLLGGGGGSMMNTIGMKLGFGQSMAPGMFGPAAQGSIFGSATLGGTMAGGFLGGTAASLLGLGNKNPMINTAASTAGALIGQALIPVPILGAAIGSFAGSALGGLFGGDMKRQTLGAGFGVSNGMATIGTLNNKGSDNETSRKFAEAILGPVNMLAQAIGATFISGFGVETNIGDKDKKTLYQGRRVSGASGDVTAIVKALLSDSRTLSGGDPALRGIVNKSLGMGSSVEQVIGDVQFAKEILALGEKIDPVADALKIINEQFDAMRKRAIDLGLPIDKLTEALDKQKQAAIDSIKAQEAGFASMEQMIATFKAFLDGQAMSDASSLNPMGKLQLAQGNFGDLLTKAQGGDASVTQDLLRAATDLINVSRGVYASSASFVAIEEFVRSSIGQIAKQLNVPGFASGTANAPAGMAWVGEQGPELVRLRGGEQIYSAGESRSMATGNARTTAQQTAMMAEMAEEMRVMSRNIMQMRKAHERAGNLKKAVG